MPNPETKICSRCHKDFTCNPTDIAACDCGSISFTAAEKEFIVQQKYKDCLCLDCLKELKAMASPEGRE